MAKSQLMKAIVDMCKSCNPDSSPKECQQKDCQLWPWRIGKIPTKAGKYPEEADAATAFRGKKDAVWKYCVWCSDGDPRSARQCSNTDCQFYPFGGRQPAPRVANLDQSKHKIAEIRPPSTKSDLCIDQHFRTINSPQCAASYDQVRRPRGSANTCVCCGYIYDLYNKKTIHHLKPGLGEDRTLN